MAESLEGFAHRYAPGPRPLAVLALHGTGGGEEDLLAVASAVLPGASVVSPRGRVSENGMARFFRRLAPGVFDLDDLRLRAAELARFTAAAALQYGLGSHPWIGLGYSNGANMAAALLLLHPRVLAGAVLLRPMLPIVPDPLPRLDGMPVWIGAGRRDPLVRIPETEALAQLLGGAGAGVTVRWEDADHAPRPAEIDAAAEWAAARFPVQP